MVVPSTTEKLPAIQEEQGKKQVSAIEEPALPEIIKEKEEPIIKEAPIQEVGAKLPMVVSSTTEKLPAIQEEQGKKQVSAIEEPALPEIIKEKKSQ